VTWVFKAFFFLHISTNAYSLTNKPLKPLPTPFIAIYPIYNYISIYSNTILRRADGHNKKTSKE